MEHPQLLEVTKNKDNDFNNQARLIKEVHILHKANLSKLGKVAVLYKNQHRESKKVKKRGCFKQINRSLGADLNEVDISELPNREFKIIVIKMLTDVRRIKHEQSVSFNKETENIKKYETEIIDFKNK